MSKKLLFFLTATTVISSFFSYLFWQLLPNVLQQPSLSPLIQIISFLVIWATLVCAFCLFNQSVIASLIFAIAHSLFPLTQGLNLYILLSSTAEFVALLTLNYSVFANQKKLIRPSLPTLLSGLSTTLSLLALAVTIFYYPLALAKSQNYHFQIPDQVFQTILSNFSTPNKEGQSNLIQQQFDAQIPYLKRQLEQAGITDPQFTNEQINIARQRFINQAGENLNTSLVDTKEIKKMVEQQIDNLLANYRPYLPLILTASFYLGMSFFVGPVDFVVILLSQSLVWLLKLLGLVSIKKESVEVERLFIE